MVFSTENTYAKPLLYQQTHKSDSLNDDLTQFQQLQQETEYGDDSDEALSFCDLPIHSSSSSSSSSNSSSSLGKVFDRNEYQEEADSFFEFGPSSKSSFEDAYDYNYGGAVKNRDAIIFCGKFIACKDVVDSGRHPPKPKCEKSSHKPDRVNHSNLKPKKLALFSWKRLKIASFTFRKSKKAEASHSHSSKKNDKTRRLEKMSPAKKVSTLLTSPTKSRWYLFMVGQTRFSQAMRMDLSDLKNRQRRRCSPSPSINLCVSGGGSVSAQGSSRGRGLWALLKDSATTSHANDVVRAVGSISLVSRVA